MKFWLIFVGFVYVGNCQRVFRCQEVSTWAKFSGLKFVPHQGVYLHGPNKIISFYGGDSSTVESWSKDWEVDEPAVTAASSMSLQKIENLRTGNYNLLKNNCIHFKNRVLRYCRRGY